MVTPHEAQALHESFKAVLAALQPMEGERGSPNGLSLVRSVAMTVLRDEAQKHGYNWDCIAFVVRWSAFTGTVDINPMSLNERGMELLDEVYATLGPVKV